MCIFRRSGCATRTAVTGPHRIAALPDVPTVAESGYPGFDVTSWHSILAPLGTPPEIVERLNRELVRIIATPDVRDRLIAIGMEPSPSSAAQLEAEIRVEVARWGPVVQRAGIHRE